MYNVHRRASVNCFHMHLFYTNSIRCSRCVSLHLRWMWSISCNQMKKNELKHKNVVEKQIHNTSGAKTWKITYITTKFHWVDTLTSYTMLLDTFNLFKQIFSSLGILSLPWTVFEYINALWWFTERYSPPASRGQLKCIILKWLARAFALDLCCRRRRRRHRRRN